MASALSGPNIEEEYMWSITLDADTKEYEWCPKDPSDEDSEDEEDPSCKPNHRLLIKTAILHPEAAKEEVTMLQIETKGYQKTKVVTPFVAMKSGTNLQQYVDVLIPDMAKIKVIAGSGPITLLGSHCVDFYDYRNYGQDETEDEDAESSEDDEMDEEEQETAVKEDKESDKEPAKETAKETKADKKKTPKKDTPKKDAKEAKEEEKKESPKEAKKTTEAKTKTPEAKSKTPDSKKRKPSAEEEVAEKKRKKSGGK